MPSKSIKGIGISSDNIKKTWEEIFLLTGQETTAEKQINQAVSKSLEKQKKVGDANNWKLLSLVGWPTSYIFQQ